MAEPADVRTDFLRHVNVYLHDAIRMADHKAMAALGVSVALLALNLAVGGYRTFTAVDTDAVAFIFGLASYVLVLFAFGTSIFAIFPRIAKDPPKGLIFWESIVSQDAAAYTAAVEGATEEALRKALAEHNHVSSKILIMKYAWLRVAWFAASVGTILTAAAIVMQR
jgi:hypothetical protein